MPMFLIDKEHGERPVLRRVPRPFAATRRQILAIRKGHPGIAVVCPGCIVRECRKPETLYREAALAI